MRPVAPSGVAWIGRKSSSKLSDYSASMAAESEPERFLSFLLPLFHECFLVCCGSLNRMSPFLVKDEFVIPPKIENFLARRGVGGGESLLQLGHTWHNTRSHAIRHTGDGPSPAESPELRFVSLGIQKNGSISVVLLLSVRDGYWKRSMNSVGSLGQTPSTRQTQLLEKCWNWTRNCPLFLIMKLRPKLASLEWITSKKVVFVKDRLGILQKPKF